PRVDLCLIKQLLDDLVTFCRRRSNRCATGFGTFDGRGRNRFADHEPDALWADHLGALRPGRFRGADADGHDRHTGSTPNERRPIEEFLDRGPGLTGTFGEHDQRFAAANHLDTGLERFAVRGATSDRNSTERPQDRSEEAFENAVFTEIPDTTPSRDEHEKKIEIRPVQ